MKPSVIGRRSQTRESLVGARWYQVDPALVSSTPAKSTAKAIEDREPADRSESHCAGEDEVDVREHVERVPDA
jgi:hypothetical protein